MAQRIYLIEDDTALRTELAHVLELSGYAVAAYEGTWGDTAATRPSLPEPDCIVLDLKLPGAPTGIPSAATSGAKARCPSSCSPLRKASSTRSWP